MLVECPHCDARVHAKILAEREYFPYAETDEFDPHKIVFLECPSCSNTLLGLSMMSHVGNDNSWEQPERLWPEPSRPYDPSVPQLVRSALQDASRCFQAGVFSACAVMCGRAIEAICHEKTGAETLSTGLKRLRDQNIIDDRLFTWGDALRKERNMGAHASIESPSRQDARDILDFAWAIVDYVYILTAKFSAYENRKKQ